MYIYIIYIYIYIYIYISCAARRVLSWPVIVRQFLASKSCSRHLENQLEVKKALEGWVRFGTKP